MTISASKRGPAPVCCCRALGILLAALALAGAFLSGACGFKLRGDVEIPAELNPMYVEEKGASAVRLAIVEQLRGSQVQLATKSKDARVIVRVSNETRGSRVAALDRGGKALAYELHYNVTFDAVAPGGKQLLAPQTLDLTRTYDNPDVQVLGKQLEADLIYEDLIRDAANRILGRLRAGLL